MQKGKKYKWFKWVGGIIIFLFLLFFAVSFFLIRHWEPIISSRIKNSIETSTDSLYRLDFSKIKFNLALGNFQILDVWLKPDTNVYKKLQGLGKAPAYLYEIKVDNILLIRSHPWKAYKEKKIDINEISIDNPEVTIISKYGRSEEDTTTDLTNITPYDLIKSVLKSVSVNEINFHNVKLKYIQEKRGKDNVKQFNFSHIGIKDLLVDSLAQYNKERPLYTEDIRLEMNDLNFPVKDSLYSLKFKRAVFSTKNSTADVEDFKFESRYGEVEFSKKFNYRKDRFNISIASLSFKDIDLRKLFYYQRLYIHQLIIDKMNLDVFDNMQIPKSEEKLTSKPLFPLQIIQTINTPFTIDSIQVKNTDISYSELDKNTGHKWRINFKNTQADISNFTNDTLVFMKNRFCVVKAHSYLQGKGKLAAKFTFEINKRDGNFECLGSLGPFDGKEINFMLVPLQKIEFASFKINKMDFAMRGDVYHTKAKLELYYNDLRIKILKTDEDNKLKSLGLISMLANVALLKKDNPNVNGDFYTAEYEYERKPENSFFGLLWKTLLRGIKNTIGITQDVEVEIKKRIGDYNSMMERRETKEERKEKREERREKRQQKRKAKLLMIQKNTEESNTSSTLNIK